MARLIQVGFGAAGTEIVRQHLGKTRDLDLFASGRKVEAIFGFCDIRRFTDATEVLQERVMPFVNLVAHIVHYKVRRYHGNPNKNIGDAFLLVWKDPTVQERAQRGSVKDFTLTEMPAAMPQRHRARFRRSNTYRWSTAELGRSLHGSQDKGVSHGPSPAFNRYSSKVHSWSQRSERHSMEWEDGIDLKYSASRANDALKTMVQIVYHLETLNASCGEILRAEIRELGFHDKEDDSVRDQKENEIKTMLEEVRTELTFKDDEHDYHHIVMGFGLHYGWAVEGAIGSSIKIDASYLSPHVNIAARLEQATKQYMVPILLSGDVYEKLAITVQRRCRKIDHVTVKGSASPISLYTWDFMPMRDSECGVDTCRKYYTSAGFGMYEDMTVRRAPVI
eukprot:g1615.t1